jgi:hypothetical protein
MTRSIQFIFCFVICSVPSLTFSQDVSVKAIDDTQAVRALTDEMRQLRIMLQKASLFGYKIQIIFEKMKMQNDNVYKIKQDLSKVVDDINEKTRELDRDTERLKDANKSSNSQSSSMLSDQKEDNNELAEIVVEEKQTIDYLTNKEGQLKYQLDKEQSILDNLSAKVDLMEQSIAK